MTPRSSIVPRSWCRSVTSPATRSRARELVVVEQQPQPVVTAAEVVGRHAAALVEQQLAPPSELDAAIRAGHQEVLLAVHRFNGIARLRSAASAASAAR